MPQQAKQMSRYKSLRAMQESIAFDAGIQTTKALIDECLNDWTQNVRTELRAPVNAVFQIASTAKSVD